MGIFKHEMKNINSLLLKIWRIDSFWVYAFEYMYTYFLKITSLTQETEKGCSWTYLLENNQPRQFLKFMISSTSRTYVRGILRPAYQEWLMQLCKPSMTFLHLLNNFAGDDFPKHVSW